MLNSVELDAAAVSVGKVEMSLILYDNQERCIRDLRKEIKNLQTKLDKKVMFVKESMNWNYTGERYHNNFDMYTPITDEAHGFRERYKREALLSLYQKISTLTKRDFNKFLKTQEI